MTSRFQKGPVFGRDTWIAFNPYAMDVDGTQTLTLSGTPEPDYDASDTVAYLDRWEGSHPGHPLGGSFYCIKADEPVPPDAVTVLIDGLDRRGHGRWLRVMRTPTSGHVLIMRDDLPVEHGSSIAGGERVCSCGRPVILDAASARCASGAEITEAKWRPR